MKSVEIIVAAHKAYDFPKDKSYAPLQVGAKISNTELNIARDDTGDNISAKNPYILRTYWALLDLEKRPRPIIKEKALSDIAVIYHD